MSSASTSSRQKYLRWINSLSVQSELIDLKLFQAKAERVQKVMATLTAEGSDNTQEVKDSQQSNSSRSNESALLVNRIEYKPKPNWAVKPVPPTIERQTGPSNSIPAINEQISPEIILTIAVFKGGDYRSEVLVELDVMGSQPLTSLKDALGRHCASNHVSHSFIEGHERTAASLIKIPKDLSGFFYIEGCFYNDTRTRSFKNYSSAIVDWIKEDSARLEYFGTESIVQKKMQESKFIELSIRLNCPYLYLHQATCAHIIVFRDVRLIHAKDERDSSLYPITTWQSKSAINPKCQICDRFNSTHMTINNERAPSNPCYWCKSCFEGFHTLPPYPAHILLL